MDLRLKDLTAIDPQAVPLPHGTEVITRVLLLPWATGLGDPPLDLVSLDGSATYWDVGKLVRQALRADANTLELLFVGSVRALDPVGEWILETRDGRRPRRP